MARIKSQEDIVDFHARASAAARGGTTIKEFAKLEGTLANNVQARLYDAVLAGLPTVIFPEPRRSARRRQPGPSNVTRVMLYTGRAKVPYLTLKVPTEVVEKAGVEGDYIQWDFSRGRVVGRRIDAPEGGFEETDDQV